MKQLILASGSPRRKELLEQANIPFIIRTKDVDESFESNQLPNEIVKYLSMKKANAIYQDYPDCIVLGSDTIVVLDGQILGKPRDTEHARETLTSLSGRTHSVLTGVTIKSEERSSKFAVETLVTFYELTESEIEYYLNTKEPFDKAGAYGIQGFGATFVKEIQGDYFSVVGLPLAKTVRELKKFGITPQ